MWVENISFSQPQEKSECFRQKKISVYLFQTNLHSSKIDSRQSLAFEFALKYQCSKFFFILQYKNVYNLLKVAT